ncbi:MAG: response regulator [Gemmatimonadales bacterium]|nr:response regulator [Gemmatimonadales bacterium]
MPPLYSGVVRLPQQPTTILVVEDEQTPRREVCRKLRALGYGVREASDGADALRVLQQHPREIDLLLVDAVMPVFNGVRLAEHVLASPRGPALLLVSDYPRSDVARMLGPLPDVPFLRRPFTTESLFRAVREALAPRQLPANAYHTAVRSSLLTGT